jgi:uncharacterized membrane protein YfcA
MPRFMDEFAVILAAMILVAAFLYSSVGHAGASGYLAAMAIMGVATEVMKPSALALNILVAAIGTYQFARAGCFKWRLFWPFAVAAIPAAYLGGAITLPAASYRPLVGVVLLWAAVRMFMTAARPETYALRQLPTWAALLCGAGVGLLAGLTGTGGGIFLTPILIFSRWAYARQAAGVSAAFILCTSIAGLTGAFTQGATLPGEWPIWAVAAVVGGLAGSYLGSRRYPTTWLRRLLPVVLVIAGLKMMFT